MYYTFVVGNKEYKLRLSTRNTIMLEKQLGMNPLAIFGDGEEIPTVTNMVNVLYCSMLQLNHGISLNDTYDIFDEWLNDGHIVTDFIPIIIDIYKASGIINESTVDTEKN